MELLLNLLWVLLAVPAYWLWRSAREEHLRHRGGSLQCLLALACVLVLLFPVVSATDDLHAMRAEMEESSANRKHFRAAAQDRGSLWNSRWQSPAIVPATGSPVPLCHESPLVLASVSCATLLAPVLSRSTRAPPVSRLS